MPAAVVVTVTVTLAAVPPTVNGFGETVQVDCEGAPVQVKVTVPLMPPCPPTLKVKVAVCPRVTLAVVEDPAGVVKVKSSPVPLSATLCGLLTALSLNETLPEAAPPAVGVKVTATVQVLLAATGLDDEQVVPEAAMANGPLTADAALMVRLALPLLVRVMVCALLVLPIIWAVKVRGADKLTAGAVPVPLRATD
jgi:hypothetical protein